MVDKMDISIGTSVVIYTMVFFILLHVVIADPNDALVLKLNKEKNTHLEVRYKGDWGSICYSKPGFDNNAAKVACQQMGFRSGKFEGKTYLPGTNLKIVLQRVTCTGQEDDLSDCQLTAPDASSSCEDAVQVDCESDPALDGLFDVNLKGNPDQANKGILNATKRDLETSVKTGAVCYDSGTAPTVAGIVCKQMGYPGVETQTAASALSSGSLFTAVCKGTEETLAKCTLTPGTTCTSNSVIDVECKLNMTTQTTFDVRLSQSSQVVAGINNGTVEVKKYGKWGVICDTGWDINDASVVCRQLGFKGAVNTTGFPKNAKFGQGTGTVFWNNMQCSGDEPSIDECKHDEVLGTGACNSVNASGVICSSEKLPTFDICSGILVTLPAGFSFIQSEDFPNVFSYEAGTTCFCTSTNLTESNTLTVYVNQKMFQLNHVESLTFYNNSFQLYGDGSSVGPFSFTNTDNFMIQFKSDKSAGDGKFKIQIQASDAVAFTCTKTIVTTMQPPTTTAETTGSSSESPPTPEKSIDNAPPGGNDAGRIGGIVGGVVIGVLIIIVVIAVLYKKKRPHGITLPGNKRRRSLVGSIDDKPSCGSERDGVDNTSFNADGGEMKQNDIYESAGDMFTVGIGVTPGKTEVQLKWKRNLESKEPETGETKQRNGGIGRPASGSDVKVDFANQAYNAYEMEGPPQLNDNPYDMEQPLKKGVESGTPGISASVDNADNQQYAVVNKPWRVPKGHAPAAPRAQPHGTITENANQDIDNGNVGDCSDMVPPVVYAEVNKPTSFIPGLSTAYADVEIDVCGAPSIQPEVPPKQETPEKETKKGKKKKKKKQEEDKEEDKKKDKRGKDKKKKRGLGSSDDVSDGRPKGDSFAVPMDNPNPIIYSEVGQKSMGQSAPVGGSQQVESDQTYDRLQRKGPKQRPAANVGVTDQTYDSVDYKV